MEGLVFDTISDLQAATAPHYWFPVACFAALTPFPQSCPQASSRRRKV
jgi:hypothetical protein